MTENLWTTSPVGKLLSLTPRRVRQLCRESGIGTKLGRDWFLTSVEVEELIRWRRGQSLLFDPEEENMKGWTCWGEICGGCGVLHRTLEAAEKCCKREQRNVQRGHPGGGSYTDMVPQRAKRVDGRIVRLSTEEEE